MFTDINPLSFRFQVSFLGENEVGKSLFQEVGGVPDQGSDPTSLDDMQLPSGWLQRKKHRNLLLKNGTLAKNSAINKWLEKITEGDTPKMPPPKTLIIKLLDEHGKLSVGWQFQNVRPVKWSISQSEEAESNEIEITSIELSFSKFDMFV